MITLIDKLRHILHDYAIQIIRKVHQVKNQDN